MTYRVFSKIVPLFLLSIALLFFHTRGIMYTDEGYMLNSAARMLHGQLPYRDFQIAYMPGVPFLLYGFFKVSGASILTGRFVAFFFSLLTAVILYKSMSAVTKNVSLIFLSLGIYLSWGPMHLNFPWPTMFAVNAGIITCCFLIKTMKQEQKKNLVLAGVFSALTFLFKQNLGVALLPSIMCFFIFSSSKRKKMLLLYYFLGLSGVLALFVFYLLATDSLYALYNTMVVRVGERLIIQKTIDTPFLYEGTLVSKMIKGIFYTLPVSLGVLSIVSGWKKNRPYTFLSVFSIGIYLLGIRPTTDYIHYVPLLATVGLSLVILIISEFRKKIRLLYVLFSVGLILLGFYTALWKGYMRWEAPLIEDRYFLSETRGNIWVDAKYASITPDILTTIKTLSGPDESIFMTTYMPMLYFLSERKNGTQFDYLSPSELDLHDQKNVIADLEKNHVSLIMQVSWVDEWKKTYLGAYIKKHFSKKIVVNDLVFFTRNK